MRMKKYQVKIKGVSILVWNRQKKELFDELKKLKKNQLSDWQEKNWLRKADFHNGAKMPKASDKAYIPQEWLKGMIVGACKTSQMVPHFATSKRETYTRYAQSLMIISDAPVCLAKDLEYHGAFVSAQGKKGGGKVWRAWPMLKKWAHEFTVVDPFGRMESKELETILEYGGFIEGIGDGRAVNNGRFELVSIEEVKECQEKEKKKRKRGRPRKEEQK